MGAGQGAVRSAVNISPASCSRSFVMRIKPTRVVAAPAHPLPPLLPKPNSGHRTALGATHTPCFGRHPGFKFIHEWQKRSARRTDRAKIKTQSKSKKWGGMRGGWRLGAGGLHPVPCSKASRVVTICRRFDCICRSARSVVMPDSATSSESGDEISTTISWNSGVLNSHTCMRRYTL